MANFSDTEGETFEVDYLLDHRGRGRSVEYLVRWKGFGDEEDSWEPVKNLGAAEEALLTYRAKNIKTPRRQSRGRDGAGDAVSEFEKSETNTKSGTVTKTVIKTQTITTKTEATDAKNTQSESSSPEASPTVTRKSLRSRKTEETEVKRAVDDSNDAAKKSAGPSRLAGLCSVLGAPCRMCHMVRLGTKDIPIMILVTCLLVIASTFYIAGK